VLSAPDVDLWKLRELCLTEGGLVEGKFSGSRWQFCHFVLFRANISIPLYTDTLRKRAWPKLVGLHGSEETQSSQERSGRSRIPRPPPAGFQFEGIHQVDDTVKDDSELSKKLIVECVDADQIDRDVARCTWHLLTGSQRSRRLQMENKHRKKVAKILQRKQLRLSNFINLTLVQANAHVSEEDDELRYYQGFHDVASVFLSSLGGGSSGPTASSSPLEQIASSMGLDLPSKVLGQVAKSHFRDAMRSSFMQLQSALRLVLFPLLARFDAEVHAHLYYCDMEPFFALSWVITWFSHDIRDTALVKRLFDAFIVSHPLFPLYLSAAMILHPVNRAEILATDCDFAAVHHTLAGLPKNSSMVGWKFKVTDGYVSGDEASTASTDMDSTFLSDDLLDLVDGESVSTGASLSGAVGSSAVRVPFQELIDTALSYMCVSILWERVVSMIEILTYKYMLLSHSCITGAASHLASSWDLLSDTLPRIPPMTSYLNRPSPSRCFSRLPVGGWPLLHLPIGCSSSVCVKVKERSRQTDEIVVRAAVEVVRDQSQQI